MFEQADITQTGPAQDHDTGQIGEHLAPVVHGIEAVSAQCA
jgi:hypothetical protein